MENNSDKIKVIVCIPLSELNELREIGEEELYKSIIDQMPKEILGIVLKNAIKQEAYELATYIRDSAKKRDIDI